MLCAECGEGGCVPLNSSPGADWVCQLCYASTDSQEVQDKLAYWRGVLDRGVNADMKELMSTIYQVRSKKESSRRFHNHR